MAIKPRLAATSFLLVLRCVLICWRRADSSATWYSAEPVSFSCLAKESTRDRSTFSLFLYEGLREDGSALGVVRRFTTVCGCLMCNYTQRLFPTTTLPQPRESGTDVKGNQAAGWRVTPYPPGNCWPCSHCWSGHNSGGPGGTPAHALPSHRLTHCCLHPQRLPAAVPSCSPCGMVLAARCFTAAPPRL